MYRLDLFLFCRYLFYTLYILSRGAEGQSRKRSRRSSRLFIADIPLLLGHRDRHLLCWRLRLMLIFIYSFSRNGRCSFQQERPMESSTTTADGIFNRNGCYASPLVRCSSRLRTTYRLIECTALSGPVRPYHQLKVPLRDRCLRLFEHQHLHEIEGSSDYDSSKYFANACLYTSGSPPSGKKTKFGTFSNNFILHILQLFCFI